VNACKEKDLNVERKQLQTLIKQKEKQMKQTSERVLSDTADPEQAMQRDLAKKKMFLTKVSEACRSEFIASYLADFGVAPDFTNPFIHTYFNAWIFHQNKTEWLTPEDEEIIKKRKLMYQKRSQASKENRLKRRGNR